MTLSDAMPVALSIIAGLTALAWNKPDEYQRILPIVVTVAITLELGFAGWNWAMQTIMERVNHDLDQLAYNAIVDLVQPLQVDYPALFLPPALILYAQLIPVLANVAHGKTKKLDQRYNESAAAKDDDG